MTPARLGLLSVGVLLYAMAAWYKLTDPVWRSGEALRLILTTSPLVTPLGRWVGTWPAEVVTFLTFAVPAGELSVALCLLVRPFRVSAFWWAAFFQLTFTLCLQVGLFPLIAIVALLPWVVEDG